MSIDAEIMMTYKKSTKGTHVYEADRPDECITTIYIRKDGFEGDEAPKNILVTVRDHD